jgi:hypothetical protein
MSDTRFDRPAVAMSAPVVIWALHFGAIYGATGVACARGAPQAAVVAVGVATLLAAVLLLVVVVRAWARRVRFEAWIAAALGGFALLGVLWEAVPVLIVEACA